jgi:hypothetical protein
MGTVYSMATSGIAWLGERATNDEIAYPFVPYRHPGRQWTPNSMKSVMTKPYWSRVWVVQEVILPRTLEVWLGEYRADADELRELLLSYEVYYFILPNEYWEPLDSIPGLKLLKCRRLFWNTRDPNTHFWRSKQDWPWEFELRWLLEKFSTSHCSLLHDRVYGLLGLVDEKTRSSYPIVPHYDKPMLELFMDVLKN